MPEINDKNQFWKEHDRLISPHSKGGQRYVLSHDMYRNMPSWFNAFYAYFQKRAIKHLVPVFPVGQHLLGLDVGCGTGRWSAMLCDLGAKMVGIDIGYNALRYASSQKNGSLFCQCSLPHLVFSSGVFDFGVSIMVLQHLPYAEQEKTVKELYRLLRPNGFLIVCEIIDENDPAPHVFSRSKVHWGQLFESIGFHIDGYLPVEYLPYVRLFQVFRRLMQLKSKSQRTQNLGVTDVSLILEQHHWLTSILKIIMYCSYPLEYVASWLLPEKFARQGFFLLRKG